ncbi:hypothetical protein [Butyrivibrio proteoclasticus]|uniref:hypothetical protein n=1 Tax=Butyrivibrio proteoclasticus TaxID=43305 RepID=UPI00047C370A|nr:hypothetical protein [Butyrivibrio proteoclasticus]
MKRILALMLVCVMTISGSICALANDGTDTSSASSGSTLQGSPSADAEYYRQKYIKALEELVEAEKNAAAASAAASSAREEAANARSDAAAARSEADAANAKVEEATAALSVARANLDQAAAELSAATENIRKEAEKNSELQKKLDKLIATNKSQSAKMSELAKEASDYQRKLAMVANDLKNAGGRGGSSGNDVRNQALIRNNAVSYGGNIVAQGGHVEINGGKSNVTFIVGVPDGGTMTSAASLAANLKGSLINCVTVTSSVAFRNARVNFYVSGVTAGDNIAVYQLQNGKWVQLPTAEIRQDHVVVDMTRYGTVAFIRVPVLASVSY